METKQKMVDFEWACKRCIHKDSPGDIEPCNECLTYPANENSRKPRCYIPMDKYKEDKP